MTRERCRTCGQPIGKWQPSRICRLCKRPIAKGHKWRFVAVRGRTTLQHRNCQNPDSYKG